MRTIATLTLSVAVLASLVIPVLADDLRVKVVSATKQSGANASEGKLVVQTDPGASCGVGVRWSGTKGIDHRDWNLATKKTGADGMVEWDWKGPTAGKIFFSVVCKLGDKEGKASAELML